jgi:hypothetical protein
MFAALEKTACCARQVFFPLSLTLYQKTKVIHANYFRFYFGLSERSLVFLEIQPLLLYNNHGGSHDQKLPGIFN